MNKPKGALVASVSENSPASKAGLKAGDIILKFDKKLIKTMRQLPKAVAGTDVGKNVELEIWRNKKLITKKLKLGRLESSKEFKEGNKKKTPIKNFEVEVETLKIKVRDVNSEDREKRKLPKNTTGVVITEILAKSILYSKVSVGDIILEIQKTTVSSNSLDSFVSKLIKQGEKNILLTIINEKNQRRYLGVKVN